MFGPAGVIFIIVLLIVAVIFIYGTIRSNTLDEKIRDKSSEIDSNLWDRAFQLTKIVEILDAKKIEHKIEAIDINTFGLGMSPVLQAANSEKLDKLDEKLRDLLDKHPELKEDEDFNTHLAKFNLARNDLFKNSLEYNKSVSKYNSFIGAFPMNIVAMFHKKKDRGLFGYYFRELDKKE